MQIKQQWQNSKLKHVGRTKAAPINVSFILLRGSVCLLEVKPIQAFSGQTSPLSTFSFGLVKFLCPPSPLLLWGFWIESSSCLVVQVSWHICQGCTEIGRSPFKIAKNTRKTTMAQPVSGSTRTCVLWLRTRYSRHFPFSIVLSSSLP